MTNQTKKPAKAKKGAYFISYAWKSNSGNGYGMFEVQKDGPFRVGDIGKLARFIEKDDPSIGEVVILNFQKLEG